MSLVVKTTAASETLQVNSSTTLKANGKVITLGDLKNGERVNVSYETQGMNKLATTIDVVAAKAGKKPAR